MNDHRMIWYPRVLQFGVHYGDLLRAEPYLLAGGWEAWAQAMVGEAEAYRARAVGCATSGQVRSAVSYYRRACDYFHFAAIKSASLEAKAAAAARSVDCFDQWRSALEPPLSSFEFDFERCHSTVYHSPWSGRPAVLLIGGLDSAKECELWYFSRYFAERGLDIAFTDLPGQGSLWGELALTEHGDDYSLTLTQELRARSHAPRIGVLGVSLGGYLALRLAALSADVAAVVSLGGFFDGAAFDGLPEAARPVLARALTLRPDGWNTAVEHVSLARCGAALEAPALIIHGDADHLVTMDQIDRIARWAKRAEVRVIAGAEHVATTRFAVVLDEMADWMAETLADPGDVPRANPWRCASDQDDWRLPE